MPRPPSSATLAELKEAAGPGNFLDSQADLAPYLSDFRRLYQGATPLVLRPRSVEEVARILRVCDRDEVAHHPVAQYRRASGIGGEVAADLRGSFRS